MNQTQKDAFAEYLEAVYQRGLAEKRGEACPATYGASMIALACTGLDLNDHVMWLPASVDVLHEGREESFVYQGILLRDDKERELLIFSGNVATDYREALLRCFGGFEVGSSVWMVVPRSGCLIVQEDPVFGSTLAYKEGFGPDSHLSRIYS